MFEDLKPREDATGRLLFLQETVHYQLAGFLSVPTAFLPSATYQSPVRLVRPPHTEEWHIARPLSVHQHLFPAPFAILAMKIDMTATATLTRRVSMIRPRLHVYVLQLLLWLGMYPKHSVLYQILSPGKPFLSAKNRQSACISAATIKHIFNKPSNSNPYSFSLRGPLILPDSCRAPASQAAPPRGGKGGHRWENGQDPRSFAWLRLPF